MLQRWAGQQTVVQPDRASLYRLAPGGALDDSPVRSSHMRLANCGVRRGKARLRQYRTRITGPAQGTPQALITQRGVFSHRAALTGTHRVHAMWVEDASDSSPCKEVSEHKLTCHVAGKHIGVMKGMPAPHCRVRTGSVPPTSVPFRSLLCWLHTLGARHKQNQQQGT